MRADRSGVSTCARGEEHYEFYRSKIDKRTRVQYDYRHESGRLFTCIAIGLGVARRNRHEWQQRIEEEIAAAKIDEESEDETGEPYELGICPRCSGSGEGLWDGTICSECGGWGEY